MEIGRSKETTPTLVLSPERAKSNHFRRRYEFYQSDQHHQQQHHHPKNRVIKMFNKVQVVYYLTRNGHLEHPHYIEVSHLATQPLRLRDVIERLTLLRGKAMPCQYSWSCKRSYKSGYVWNDLTENDPIYASDGSEYVLKGSELMQDRDFSEVRSEEPQNNKGRQHRRSSSYTKPDSNVLMSNKAQQRHSFRHVPTNDVAQLSDRNCEQNGDTDDYEEEEEEEQKRVSCNSSNAAYAKPIVEDLQAMMQTEQDESYSIPSTSSTNSDKHPAAKTVTVTAVVQKEMKPAVAVSESRRQEEEVVIEEDGDPHYSPLTRNPVLLQLIACAGGGGFTGARAAKTKPNIKGSKNNFNFNMKSTFIPCLKQQLSTRGMSMVSNPTHRGVEGHATCSCKAAKSEEELRNKEEDDEDMIMVRYMSENPRFGNLQSEDREYFSGTIVETMAHQHTQSTGPDSGFPRAQAGHTPYFAKSSSYNEQRSSKAGLQAVASKAMEEDEDEDVKVKGIIKLCLPRKKSYLSNSTKLNKL